MSESTTTPAAKKTAAKKTAAAQPAASGGSDKNKTRNKAYSAATGRLRDAHRDEFEDLLADECARLGVEYKRRLSPAEKAAAQVEKLLAENPELRDRFGVTGPPATSPQAGELAPTSEVPAPDGNGGSRFGAR